MKKILFFGTVLAILFSVTSCDKDDKDGSPPKDDVLYKTWYRVGGYSGGETLYDEFIFNADGTFEYKRVTTYGYSTIDGTFRIVDRIANFTEDYSADAYTIMGYKVIAKFTIDFNGDGDVEKEDVYYLEKSGIKTIVVPYLFGRIGDFYRDRKN